MRTAVLLAGVRGLAGAVDAHLWARRAHLMQTLHGIRFLRVARIHGVQLGFDARWLGVRELAMLVLLTLAALVAQSGQDSDMPFWARLAMAVLFVPGIVLTSLGHELGHVLASRCAGLSVSAVVLAPQGGATIHAGSDNPAVNFLTALAGPAANALLGTMCVWLALALHAEGLVTMWLLELAALQVLTALANLVPIGPMDGQRMLAAWQAASTGHAPPSGILPVV